MKKNKIKIIKKMIFLIFVIMLVICPVVTASELDETDIINSRIESLDLEDLNKIIGGSQDDAVNKLSIQDLVVKAIEGKLDLSPQNILKNISASFFGEIRSLASLVRNMLLIAILSAFLYNLSSSFKQNDAAELGFFMCYLSITIILMSSFMICVEVVRPFINDICAIMQAGVPVSLTLMAMSGNVGSAYIFNPIIIFVINALSLFIRDIIIPVLIFAAILKLINFISVKEILVKLSDLLKNCASWALKATTVIFVGIISLQAVSAPLVNTVVTKSAKAALNVVPVVGQALSGAVDLVTYWSSAIKSGFMAAFIIIIILMCFGPIIKLIAFIAVFKVTAAIIQPISDERIVKATDCVGSFTAVLLGACVCVTAMFIFMIIVMLSI